LALEVGSKRYYFSQKRCGSLLTNAVAEVLVYHQIPHSLLPSRSTGHMADRISS